MPDSERSSGTHSDVSSVIEYLRSPGDYLDTLIELHKRTGIWSTADLHLLDPVVLRYVLDYGLDRLWQGIVTGKPL